MKNKLNKLEAIRGIAALYVVFHHSFFSEDFKILGHNLSFLFKFGQEAVILFFLMSGFVIGYSFDRSKDKSFESYFQKRFYRIFIPLIFVIVTHYLILSYQKGFFINPQWVQLFGNLLMLQDISALKPNVICDPYLGNSPLWSLSYEWWFYMSFYFIYAIFKKTPEKIEAFVAVVVIVSAVSYIFYPNFLNRLLMYYGIWWIGVMMAKSFLTNGRVRIKDISIPFISLLLATVILAINCYVQKDKISTIGVSPHLEFRHFSFTIIALAIAITWQRCKWLYFDKIFERFSFFAPFSYVLYISHNFLVTNASYLNLFGNRYIAFFIYLSVALLYAYLVEVILYPKIRGLFIKR